MKAALKKDTVPAVVAVPDMTALPPTVSVDRVVAPVTARVDASVTAPVALKVDEKIPAPLTTSEAPT